MDDEQVHHPEMRPVVESEKNGLICWRDVDRPCGADCMAYSNPPMMKGPDYDGKQWANCLVLTSMYQESKHVAISAQHLVKQARTPAPPKTSVG